MNNFYWVIFIVNKVTGHGFRRIFIDIEDVDHYVRNIDRNRFYVCIEKLRRL